ncbi:MAG: flagellar assembly protein T N-terminal domain-containing protein [Actinomycetes bacterium]
MSARTTFLFLLALIGFGFAQAEEIIVVGTAHINGNNTSQAREVAIRRALSRASESQGVAISSQTTVRLGNVTEASQMRTSGCIGKSRVVDESTNGGEVSITMSVVVNVTGDCNQVCNRSYVNKIIVADFGFEFPEQVLPQEKAHFKYRTAGEIARAFRGNGRILVGIEASTFPYVSASGAPEPFLFKSDTETPFEKIARSHRGQYVLSGVYRDFEVVRNPYGKPMRRIGIEAYIHDGANGALLARQFFQGIAIGTVEIGEYPAVGSVGFYQTDFGTVWGLMLKDIARWAESKTNCFPFIARVIKNDKDGIVIDAGAESGLTAGDTLNLHLLSDKPVRGITQGSLGSEKEFGGIASLQFVYPKFSIIQLQNEKDLISKLHVGDLLYSE